MPLSGKEILKEAIKIGWVEVRNNGTSHHIVEKNGESVSIPVHGNKDLHKGLEQKLVKQLGLKK